MPGTYKYTIRTPTGLGEQGTIPLTARRRLASLDCVSVKGDTITLDLPPKRCGDEKAARDAVNDLINDAEISELVVVQVLRTSSPDEHVVKRPWISTTRAADALGSESFSWAHARFPRTRFPHLRRLGMPLLRPLRYQGQEPVRFPALQRIMITRRAGTYEDIDSAEPLCSLLVGVARICFGGDCPPSRRCTCWDARNKPQWKSGDSRIQLRQYQDRFKAIGDLLTARERELRSRERTALNVLHIAESARNLPQEVLDMVFSSVGLTRTQVARATELATGEATLAHRAAAMAHLDGDEFGLALERWLGDELGAGPGAGPSSEGR